MLTVFLCGIANYLQAWKMKNLLPFGLVVCFIVFDACMLVAFKSRKIPQAHIINTAMSIFEPFVDPSKLCKYTCGVTINHVNRGHIPFAFIAAQVEADILML
jgi:hypothetical protein